MTFICTRGKFSGEKLEADQRNHYQYEQLPVFGDQKNLHFFILVDREIIKALFYSTPQAANTILQSKSVASR